MRICRQCQTQMEEGYRIRVSTYGIPKLEQGTTKTGEVQVAVCPGCGEISLYLRKEETGK